MAVFLSMRKSYSDIKLADIEKLQNEVERPRLFNIAKALWQKQKSGEGFRS